MRRSIKIFVVVVLITGMSLGVFVPSAPGYAVALVDDFIIAITALASTMGIDFGITGGWDVYRNFMAGELETYAAGAGTTLPGILGDAKIGHGQSGRLIIDNPTLLKMRTIIAALTATWGLVNNSSETMVDTAGYRLGDGSLFIPAVCTPNQGVNYIVNNISSCSIFRFDTVYFLNGSEFYVNSDGTYKFGSLTGTHTREPVSTFTAYTFGVSSSNTQPLPSASFLGVMLLNESTGEAKRIISGGQYSVYFGSGDVQSVVVETTTVDIPSAETVGTKGVAVSVGAVAGASYADVLEAIQTGVLAGDLTAVATYEESSTLDEDLVVTPDYSAGDFQSPGLQSVFPFCLPFDIYNFVTALAADPVAPSFDVPFVIPGLVDYTFHLDLSAFNSVAAILRTLELLAFCVGLAFVTRHLIRG